MSESMRRIYVEKKKEYAVEAAGLLADLVGTLGMTQLTGCLLYTSDAADD